MVIVKHSFFGVPKDLTHTPFIIFHQRSGVPKQSVDTPKLHWVREQF